MQTHDTQSEAKINLAITPELVARVDAWLASRRGQHLWLANDWRKASALWRHRRSKDPADSSGAVASAVAAMRGILLALVREAWVDQTVHVRAIEDPEPEGYAWMACNKYGAAKFARLTWSRSEAERLVAALEAAP